MAKAFLFALAHRDKMAGQTYNVGSNGMNYSKEDVAGMLKTYRPNYFLHFADAGKDEDQRNYEVKYDKINALGFTTDIDIKRGLDDLTQVMSILNFKNPYSNV
jgi:nucleoside-diphosphate-sugar epimerase